MLPQPFSTPPRQIRAVTNTTETTAPPTITVYQAYNTQIARLASEANSFQAPLDAGCWSQDRMTWIKPSAVWMGYRCGWGLYKDDDQSAILALEISLSSFYTLLRMARLSSHKDDGKQTSDVVVQWDPERYFCCAEDGNTLGDAATTAKNCYTMKSPRVKGVGVKGSQEAGHFRSIQIGLRNKAVAMLLDPTIVINITDVTERFHACGKRLAQPISPTNSSQKCREAAAQALWNGVLEQPLSNVPLDIQDLLQMTEGTKGPEGPTTVDPNRSMDKDEETTTTTTTTTTTPSTEHIAVGIDNLASNMSNILYVALTRKSDLVTIATFGHKQLHGKNIQNIIHSTPFSNKTTPTTRIRLNDAPTHTAIHIVCSDYIRQGGKDNIVALVATKMDFSQIVLDRLTDDLLRLTGPAGRSNTWETCAENALTQEFKQHFVTIGSKYDTGWDSIMEETEGAENLQSTAETFERRSTKLGMKHCCLKFRLCWFFLTIPAYVIGAVAPLFYLSSK